jgi:hypothetical protein
MYMSNHPDTLVSYAKCYGKVTENLTSARMTAIDSQKMTLTCQFQNGSTREVHIPFEPPLVHYDELKPRMMEMGAIAQEKLGMTKTPQITSFQLPVKGALYVGAWIGAVTYFVFAPVATNTSPLFLPAQVVRSAIGPKPFLYMFYSTLVAHVLEAAYTFTLCRRHRTGLFVGAGYVAATIVFGFPIWTDFKRRVHALRIDSIMKVK